MMEGGIVQAVGEKIPDRFVGYGPASIYLGLKRNTLSSYVARGVGPTCEPKPQAAGQYNLPVFSRAELDAWRKARPGQGAPTRCAACGAPPKVAVVRVSRRGFPGEWLCKDRIACRSRKARPGQSARTDLALAV